MTRQMSVLRINPTCNRPKIGPNIGPNISPEIGSTIIDDDEGSYTISCRIANLGVLRSFLWQNSPFELKKPKLVVFFYLMVVADATPPYLFLNPMHALVSSGLMPPSLYQQSFCSHRLYFDFLIGGLLGLSVFCRSPICSAHLLLPVAPLQAKTGPEVPLS